MSPKSRLDQFVELVDDAFALRTSLNRSLRKCDQRSLQFFWRRHMPQRRKLSNVLCDVRDRVLAVENFEHVPSFDSHEEPLRKMSTDLVFEFVRTVFELVDGRAPTVERVHVPAGHRVENGQNRARAFRGRLHMRLHRTNRRTAE